MTEDSPRYAMSVRVYSVLQCFCNLPLYVHCIYMYMYIYMYKHIYMHICSHIDVNLPHFRGQLYTWVHNCIAGRTCLSDCFLLPGDEVIHNTHSLFKSGSLCFTCVYSIHENTRTALAKIIVEEEKKGNQYTMS